MNVPILEAMIRKDSFSTIKTIFPAHELPIWLAKWGESHLELTGKSEERHEISNIEEEVERMMGVHGIRVLQETFGASYIDGIELSINRIMEKEKGVNDSTNAAKSKNRTSTEARV
jgi:hypothetical protein